LDLSENEAEQKAVRGAGSKIFLVAVNLISLAGLLFTLRGAHLGELTNDLATMNWWWVALAVLADVCVYFCHAVRWRSLLKPVEQFSFLDTARAIYIGLLANWCAVM